MKPPLPLQTLILRVLAPLLLVLTGGWGWFVYSSVHRTILEGFDRKLLALSGGATAFVDADAHASFQRRRSIAALCAGPDDRLLGYDADTGELVSINPANGGASGLGLRPAGAIRSLAYDAARRQVLALSASGNQLERFTLDPAQALPALTLAAPLDGLFADGDTLAGWSGQQLLRIDPTTGGCTPLPAALPEAVAALCRAGDADRFLGLSADGTTLLSVERNGKLLTRTTLLAEATPLPALRTLAPSGGALFAAGPSLTGIDPATGRLDGSASSTGYLDDLSPFYRHYRAPFIAIRSAAQLTFLYTYVYLGEDKLYYVLDGTEGEKHSLPGADDRIPNAEAIDGARRAQFLGQPWVSPLQHWEQWGLLKTSSFPIAAADGRIVALAGSDVDITIIREKTRWAMAAVLFVGVGSLIAAALISLLIARSLTRPLRELKESALRIAAGYYRTPLAAGGHRETADLAATLNFLSERLDEEARRSRAYQSSLHARRRETTLARALEDLAARGTGQANEASATALRASGNCWRGLDGMFWQGPVIADSVTAACLRARLACLGRSLLAAAIEPQEAPTSMLASAPALTACARWHTASHQLYYATRRPCRLRIGNSIRILEGRGHIALTTDESCEWADADPDSPGSEGGPQP